MEQMQTAKELGRAYFTLSVLVDMLLNAQGKKPSEVWAIEKNALWERVRSEANAGRLRMRHPETYLIEPFADWPEPSCYALVTSLDDANEWLSIQGVPYRLPSQTGSNTDVKTGQATQAEQPATGKVWTEQRKAEARAYRTQHGLTKTAEYYKVSVTTISKHIPAGKVKPKKVTPFSGLGGK